MAYFVFILLAAIILLAQSIHDNQLVPRHFYVTPIMILNLGWVLYGATPIIFIHDISDSRSVRYIICLVLTLVAWLAGVIVSGLCLRRCINGHVVESTRREGTGKGSIIIVSAILVAMYYYIDQLYGGLLEYVTLGYGRYNSGAISSLVSSIPFLVAGLLFFLNAYGRSKLAVIFGLAIALVFALGGNRNIFAFIVLGIIYAKLKNKRVRLATIALVAPVIAFLAAFLAVAREYGIGLVLAGGASSFEAREVLAYFGRYNEGEFGTLYRVFNYVADKGGGFEYYFPSFSYFFSPIVNLIPTSLLPSRPYTIATEFTFYYWGGKAEFLEGLGFSPLAEAMINFGSFFLVPIFIFSFALSYISKLSLRDSRFSTGGLCLLVTCISAASLNYFRIDMAIYIKFIVIAFMSSLMALLFARFLNSPNRVKQTL